MRISQDILFVHLSKRLDVEFSRRVEAIECKYPTLFDPSIDQSQCLVIISKKVDARELDATKYQECLFVCTEAGLADDVDFAVSLITINESVSVEKLLSELQDIFYRINHWIDCLKEVLMNKGSFKDLSDYTEQVIFDPYAVQDNDFHYVTYGTLSEERGLVAEYVNPNGNAVSLESVNYTLSSKDYSKNFNNKDPYLLKVATGYSVNHNIFYQEERVGRIVVFQAEYDDIMVRFYSDIITVLALYYEKLYERNGGFFQEETDHYLRDYVADLLDGKKKRPSDKLYEQMEWEKADDYVLIQLRPAPHSFEVIHLHYLISEVEGEWKGCLVFEHKGKTFILVNNQRNTTTEKKEFLKALPIFLRDNLLAAGISRTFHDLLRIPTAFEQTEAAFEIGQEISPMQWSYEFDDLAFAYLLEHGCGSFSPQDICSTKLLKLKKHDDDKKSELCKTLKVYFDCNFNAVAAANKLCIHRTTFINRIERIREIADINFSFGEERLYLALSLALLDKERLL